MSCLLLLVGLTKVDKRDGNGVGIYSCGIYIVYCHDSHGFYDEKECAVDSLIESINRCFD